jgi:hypothetical protein
MFSPKDRIEEEDEGGEETVGAEVVKEEFWGAEEAREAS